MFDPNHFYKRAVSRSLRGAAHERHERWRGMRWTLWRRRRTNRGGRQNRVVLAPRRWRQVCGKTSQATVANKPGHRGERGISRKPLRRESRIAPLNLYARVRFLCQLAHETAGAARTRLSLRPPTGGQRPFSKPRALHAARSQRMLKPSLRGAKRRSNPASLSHRNGLLRGACHRAALRADPLARNDGWLFGT